MKKSEWVRHGFLNTLEHAISRIADALASLALIAFLPVEKFSQLALAQAWVAPVLFLFVAPETALYRDFGKWKLEGRSALTARIRALRLFGLGKAQFALALSLILALVLPGPQPWASKLAAFVWAFALVLTPQVAGTDREFLRLSLRLRDLNLLNLYQRLTWLIGTIVVVTLLHGELKYLAALGAFCLISTYWLGGRFSSQALVETAPVPGSRVPEPFDTLREAISGFSLWNHLWGTIYNWVQTLDVLILGLLSTPARAIGLYAAGLKLANFSMALPTALANLLSIWMGRRTADSEGGRERERKELFRMGAWVTLASAGQAVILALLAPWLLKILSHGRWSPDEQRALLGWFFWILGGIWILSIGFFINVWLNVRADIRKLLLQVHVPWAAIAIAIYAFGAYRAGPLGAAIGNVATALVYVTLICCFFYRQERRN